MASEKARGVLVRRTVEEDFELGREFMESPKRFAETYGLDPENLKCPDEAHDALKRGERFAEKAAAARPSPDDASMRTLDAIAKSALGDDYEVALIPFGLKFRERANTAAQEITGTGSGTISWVDTDADVDS